MIETATFEAIIADIADGMSMAKACAKAAVNRRKFFADLEADAERANRYARAKQDGLEVWADQIVDLADECRIGEKRKTISGGKNADGTAKEAAEEVITADMVERTKLQIDSRKWLLARLVPAKYGDRTTLAGDPSAPFVFQLTDTQAKL